MNLRGVEPIERFIGNPRHAESFRCRVGKHVQPPRCHEADAEGKVAAIDEMDGQDATIYNESLTGYAAMPFAANSAVAADPGKGATARAAQPGASRTPNNRSRAA